MNGRLALEKLIEGNKRFVDSKSIYPNQDKKRRLETLEAQNPFAVVITCSDSRVCPEILFDQGIGDLFIIRTAGNVLDDHVLGSVEYAVKYVNVGLIVVLGHENCAAIDTAIKNIITDSHMDKVLETIKENIGSDHGNILCNAVRTNVNTVIKQLKLSPVLSEKSPDIIGAFYNLESGIVDIITSMEPACSH